MHQNALAPPQNFGFPNVYIAIINHCTASHLQSHPCLVSCTYYTIPIVPILGQRFFYLFVLFSEEYVRMLTYSIVTYVYARALA